jgi:hypothetical protein
MFLDPAESVGDFLGIGHIHDEREPLHTNTLRGGLQNFQSPPSQDNIISICRKAPRDR